MKLNLTIVIVATVLTVGIAEAQLRTVTKTGPNGKTLTLKMDGKYSTCIGMVSASDTHESATRYCDSKPDLKR